MAKHQASSLQLTNIKEYFDVVVIATMSSGKSTLINALIGQELLHSANEATTATITCIQDKDGLTNFFGSAYSYQNKLLEQSEVIDSELMKKWNADPQIKMIDLVGDIQALYNDQAELIIYDTPGPNNSQDNSHETLTMEVIDNGYYDLILYVLNATQLGTNDDYLLLTKIQQTLIKDPNKQIIFVLNKADMLDEEKGENIEQYVENTKHYLEKIEFIQPIIIPTAANYALVVNKVINGEPLTRRQKIELEQFLNNESNRFIEASTLSPEDKENIHNKYLITKERLEKSLYWTGFGAIQYLLQKKLATSAYKL